MQGGDRDRWRLRYALGRALSRVARHLDRQRNRGRTPSTDALAGFAIEPGEAEGLISELADVFGTGPREPLLPLEDVTLIMSADLPLARAVLAFELTANELDAVMLALAVEVDARFARLIAYVNDHVGRPRPTLGLAYAIEDNASLSPALLERPFVRDGLVELEGDGPLSSLAIKIPRTILTRLAAEDADAPLATSDVRVTRIGEIELDDLVLDRAIAVQLRAWGRAPDRPLLLAGPVGVGRSTCARATLVAAGWPAIVVRVDDPSELGAKILAARREARWYRGGIVVCLGPGWPTVAGAQHALWAALAGVAAPIAVTAAQNAVEAIAEAAPREPHVATLGAPDLPTRARLWQAMVPPGALSSADADELAARFEFTPKTIARTIRRAALGELSAATLRRAAREVGASQISSIAQRLPLVYKRDDLVLPPKLFAELDLAIAWLRHKRHVYETWGFGQRIALGRGLTALFSGPPGTGKTMTAQVLAGELGLDLYRVDLSNVMSKYIGETEKNLSRLFDEAQASGAVLFFDEADALFGKRSEVRDAHDRYANVEVGYLLQRMEEHEGAAILATNRLGDLDEAFIRRFHFLLDFPMPDAAYRLRLWEGMLPADAERDPDMDLSPLADSYELSGGEIRNCVLAAAYMAAAEGNRVGYDHLERGLLRELGKTGRIATAPRRQVAREEV